ncbi:hypothetical protein TEA_008572 [Camellia sinensis var. sinensis]|uniref:PGG domain-containing protein n=1 Tax=Camellia sinensis var. sinensis TaxID=542762 RepID=A0A4S4EI84_CAMSN|nr:hypothetical protein TEA_008572 [Camellia sinensis var. sinensis]
MKGQWELVVEIYKKYAEVHRTKISISGDTALHLAVSVGQDKFVKQLVDTIYEADEHGGGGEPTAARVARSVQIGGGEEEKAPKALRIKNERGNTPLHLAAASGSLAMCDSIANKHPNLIFIQNKEQMNPLFLAALNGKKDAFLCLDNLCCDKKPLLEYCRGSNADTFLHAALNREYFGTFVEELKEDKGKQEPEPAENYQTCFFIYGLYRKVVRVICTFVEELKEDKGKKEPEPVENYQTCFFIHGLYRKVVRVIFIYIEMEICFVKSPKLGLEVILEFQRYIT